MNWKKPFLATIAALSVTTPILALESSIDMTSTVMTTSDHAILFEQDASSAELLALSPQEMQATKGARIHFKPRIQNQNANQANNAWNYLKYPIRGTIFGAFVGLGWVVAGPQAPVLALDEAAALIGTRTTWGGVIGLLVGIPANTRFGDNPTWDELATRNFRFRR